MSEFVGAQFFFDNMTKRVMKEYAMTGEVDSHILVLTDGTEGDGSKKVVGTEIINAFEKDGLEFLASMLAHAAQKMGFIKKLKELEKDIVAIYEAYLIKSKEEDGQDTLLTVHTYREVTIKRTFIATKNSMVVNGDEVNYELAFTEIDDD